MDAKKIPEFVEKLAAAGERWVRLCPLPSMEDLELCRRSGLQIEVEGDSARLNRDPSSLVPDWIQQESLVTAWDRLTVESYWVVGSTNDRALEAGREGAAAGLVVTADAQSAGRGRRRRAWISPSRAGLYFSLLLRPNQSRQHWPLLTHVAAVALVEAIADLGRCGIVTLTLEPEIKWPNDIMIADKKTAGILLEAPSGSSGDPVAVVGVGVNCAPDALPAELAGRATSLGSASGCEIPRRWLLVRFLEHFQSWYSQFEDGRRTLILEAWKARSRMWNGSSVSISDGNSVKVGTTCGLDENGALLVRYDGGRIEPVLAADVSIRDF
jgi:BirA family transcriptional regulator, biotin operon repressor / biotin---[acetyl-CoA-carboxylase] ligase